MCLLTVLERPSSQMSYLDQFLKETNSSTQQQQQFEGSGGPVPSGPQQLLYQGGSIESEEGDIEDNRALSMSSSKSNLSELSMVREWTSFRLISDYKMFFFSSTIHRVQ